MGFHSKLDFIIKGKHVRDVLKIDLVKRITPFGVKIDQVMVNWNWAKIRALSRNTFKVKC